MFGYLLKKAVSGLLLPLPVCTLLLLSGVLLLACSRRRRTGLLLTAMALGILLAMGYGLLGNAVLRRLEWQHAPLAPAWSVAELAAGHSGPVWIVVLGSSLSEDDVLPANSRLEPHFLVRVTEGLRLLRQDPRALLLLSLPGPLAPGQKRALADELCRGQGVAPERVSLVTDALDTVDEARRAAKIVGEAPLLLVTSASHLPRAMRLFAGVGLHPIASPTDFLTPRAGAPRSSHRPSVYPSAGNVLRSERALYECLGLVWTRLRGQTAPPRLARRPALAAGNGQAEP